MKAEIMAALEGVKQLLDTARECQALRFEEATQIFAYVEDLQELIDALVVETADYPDREEEEALRAGRGNAVVVRAYGNKPLIRWVWLADTDTVSIVDGENYRRLSQGLEGLWPVTFHRHDVYVYDRMTFPHATEGVVQGDDFWATLQHY